MCMKKMIGKAKDNIISNLLMIVIGSFYFFFLCSQEMVLQRDSYAYIDYRGWGKSAVMPLYPCFLKIVKIIFKTEIGTATCIIQGIIALVTSLLLVDFIRKTIDLRWGMQIIIFVCSLLPYGYTLPEYVSNHTIMTENLAFPMFVLFSIYIYKMVYNFNGKNVLIGFGLCILMVMCRTQMLVFLIVWLMYFLVTFVKKKLHLSNVSFANMIVVIISILILLLAMNFSFIKYIDGKDFSNQLCNAMMGKALTIMEQEDIKLFEGDEIEMFDNIYTEISETGYLLENSRKDLLMWEDVVKYNNENMKTAYENIFHSAAKVLPDSSYEEMEKKMNCYMNSLTSRIILHHPLKYMLEMVVLIPSSILSIIFVQKRELYTQCTIIGFGILIFWLFEIFITNKTCKLFPEEVCFEYEFATQTLCIAIVNVIVTNLILFGIQRYMVYSMGMIYISIFLLLKIIFDRLRR